MTMTNRSTEVTVTLADRERAERVCREIYGAGNAVIRNAPMRLVEKIAEAIAEERERWKPY